jgi:hypothetical protein
MTVREVNRAIHRPLSTLDRHFSVGMTLLKQEIGTHHAFVSS